MKSPTHYSNRKHLLRWALILVVALMLVSGADARSFNPYLPEGRVANYFVDKLQLDTFDCNHVMAASNDAWLCAHLPPHLIGDPELLELAVTTFMMGAALEVTGELDFEVLLNWETRESVRLTGFRIGYSYFVVSYSETLLTINSFSR